MSKQNNSNKKSGRAAPPRKQVKATLGPNKKVKNSKKAARRAMAPAAAARAERFYLSPCSKTYLKALCDPFSLDAGMACVPDLRDIPSQKLMVKARGIFQAGTNGFGYVVASPFISVNDATAGYRTTSTHATNTIDFTVGADLASFTCPQATYTTANIANIQQRTVASGIRCRYLGTELNRSGRMFLVRLPTGSSCLGYSVDNILSNNAVQSIPVTRKWSMITFIPQNDSDYDYVNNSGTVDVTDTTRAGRLAVVVDGTVASNAFEFEVCWHKEYFSRNQNVIAVPNLTTSHSDVNGLSAIRNYFEGSIDYLGGPELFKNAMNFVNKYSPVEVSHITTAGGMLYTAARAGGYL